MSRFLSDRVNRNFLQNQNFGGPRRTQPPQHVQQEEQQVSSPGRYYQDVTELTGQTPALDQYRDYLGQLPKMEDHQPNTWTRIAAGMAGFGAGYRDPQAGVKVAQDINMRDYNRALQDYSYKAGNMKEAADLESQGIDQKVKYVMKAHELGLSYDEYRRKVEEDQFNRGHKTRELDHTIDKDGKTIANQTRNTDSLVDFRRNTSGIGWANAETNRYNATTGRLNYGVNARNADTNAYSAETGRLNHGVNQQNANTNWFNAATNYQDTQSQIGRRGAQTAIDWGRLDHDREMGRGNLQLGQERGQREREQQVFNMEQPKFGNQADQIEQSELRRLHAEFGDNVVTVDDRGNYMLAPMPAVGTMRYEKWQAAQKKLNEQMNYRMQFGQVGFGAPKGSGGGSDWQLQGRTP
jgi:hypothetical protein